MILAMSVCSFQTFADPAEVEFFVLFHDYRGHSICTIGVVVVSTLYIA